MKGHSPFTQYPLVGGKDLITKTNTKKIEAKITPMLNIIFTLDQWEIDLCKKYITEEIEKFYFERIKFHSDNVIYHGKLLGYDFSGHDIDKLEHSQLKYPYILYTWYTYQLSDTHVLSDEAHVFKASLPSEIREMITKAGKYHSAINKHHVAFWHDNMSDIPERYLVEMVCDWYSIDIERGQEPCFSRAKTPVKVPFSESQESFIIQKFATLQELSNYRYEQII